MYEKFAICCIYDKISAGFYRVQILRKAYMKTLHFSPLVLFLLHYEFIFTPMRVPWNFHGICAFELFVLKRIFSYNTPYTLRQHAARNQDNAIAGISPHVHCPVNV